LTGALVMSAIGPMAAAMASVPSPTITGSITGVARHGHTLTFRLEATAPRGAGNVTGLQVALLLHSVILDQIVYDASARTVSTPSSLPVAVGSSSQSKGMFLEVAGRDVGIEVHGDRLSATIRARIVQDLPGQAQFSLAVITLSQVARVFRPVVLPVAPSRGGFPWGSLALAVVAALFFGGFVGNLFSSRYRVPPKLSVYDVIRRHMSEEAREAV
jgi:hypothetical protein